MLKLCALKAFKHAKQMADAEAAQRKTPVKLASADEIRRVLNAKTDYDCLQVNLKACSRPGYQRRCVVGLCPGVPVVAGYLPRCLNLVLCANIQ